LQNFDEIELKDIINSSFILREAGSGTREILENKLKEINVNIEDLKVVANVADSESIKEMVALGTGVSFISEKSVLKDLCLNKYKVLNLSDIELHRKFYLVCHKNRNLDPLGKNFKD